MKPPSTESIMRLVIVQYTERRTDEVACPMPWLLLLRVSVPGAGQYTINGLCFQVWTYQEIVEFVPLVSPGIEAVFSDNEADYQHVLMQGGQISAKRPHTSYRKI
jgi:hypothetical protein